MNKPTLAILAVAIISSVVATQTIQLGMAQIKPAIPEFTVKYADYSYDISASTSIDPFTDKIVTNPAQHVENKTIQLTIKNQIISSSDYLYYEIRMKGHFSQEWTNISFIQANTQSEYTELTYSLAGNNASGHFDSRLDKISYGGTADFQVQAQIWHYVRSDNFYSQFGGGWLFRISDYSDWSNTQTITIPESTPVPTEEPTPSTTPPSTPAPSTITLTPTPTTSTQEQTASSPSPTQQPTDLLETAIPMEYVLVIIAVIVIALVAGIGIGFRIKSRKTATLTHKTCAVIFS